MADKQSIYTPKTAPVKKGQKRTPVSRIVALIMAVLMILGGAVSTLYYLFGQAKLAPMPIVAASVTAVSARYDRAE